MKTFAALLYLAGAVASAVVPQQLPVTITRNSSMLPCDDGWEGSGLRFKLGPQSSTRFNRSQCAVAEIAWTKTVSPYRLGISIMPAPESHGVRSEGNTEVIEDIDSTSYPVLIRGPAGSVIRFNLTDALGGRVILATVIRPSSDSSCLD
ncbi:hypothetical protein V8D89_014355 [Ganoderma adspersum]